MIWFVKWWFSNCCLVWCGTVTSVGVGNDELRKMMSKKKKKKLLKGFLGIQIKFT